MIDLSIIFPCYNEEKNLALLIKKIIATKKKIIKQELSSSWSIMDLLIIQLKY